MASRRNVEKGAGPVYVYQRPVTNQKSNRNGKYSMGSNKVNCGVNIDNVVTYVYNINNDGNHLSYVDCGYVE